jgi:DNA-binding LytR/AlgR family response regulator
MKLKCLIVDDEPSGRYVIEEYVSEVSFLQIVGIAENALKANELILAHKTDLIFLDIQMPKLNGFDFLRTLNYYPMVILTTAYSEYGLQGFEYNALDYLLKPISIERFLKSVNKAKDYYEMRYRKGVDEDCFFVKCNNKYEKINYGDLLFVEAANNYVILKTRQKRIITYLTFRALEDELPAGQFIKVHKSFIVALSKIDNLDREEISIGDNKIPISRSMREEVLNKIVNSKLLKR